MQASVEKIVPAKKKTKRVKITFYSANTIEASGSIMQWFDYKRIYDRQIQT